MEVISGAHCIDDDIGERAGIETFDLDMVAEGGEVAIESTQLRSISIVVGVLRWRLRNGSMLVLVFIGSWWRRVVWILRVLHHH